MIPTNHLQKQRQLEVKKTEMRQNLNWPAPVSSRKKTHLVSKWKWRKIQPLKRRKTSSRNVTDRDKLRKISKSKCLMIYSFQRSPWCRQSSTISKSETDRAKSSVIEMKKMKSRKNRRETDKVSLLTPMNRVRWLMKAKPMTIWTRMLSFKKRVRVLKTETAKKIKKNLRNPPIARANNRPSTHMKSQPCREITERQAQPRKTTQSLKWFKLRMIHR